MQQLYAQPNFVEDLGDGWVLKTYDGRAQRYALCLTLPKGNRTCEWVVLFTNDKHEAYERARGERLKARHRQPRRTV